jgi:hypothetical protein
VGIGKGQRDKLRTQEIEDTDGSKIEERKEGQGQRQREAKG